MALDELKKIDEFEINEDHLGLLDSVPEIIKPILKKIDNRMVFYIIRRPK